MKGTVPVARRFLTLFHLGQVIGRETNQVDPVPGTLQSPKEIVRSIGAACTAGQIAVTDKDHAVERIMWRKYAVFKDLNNESLVNLVITRIVGGNAGSRELTFPLPFSSQRTYHGRRIGYLSGAVRHKVIQVALLFEFTFTGSTE